MDNAQKAIMIGVGLFITIIIISAVLLIVNLGTGLVDDATSNLSSISSTLQNQILQNYDAKLISGTQVRSAINQYMTSADVALVLAKGSTVSGSGASATRSSNAVAWSGAECYIADNISIVGGRASVTETNIPTTAGSMDSTKISTLSVITNPGNTAYVNASTRYYSFIIYNQNDAMVGIVFVPQNAMSTAGDSIIITAS